MNKKVGNYKGTNIEEIYRLALIGAEFATEQTKDGIMVVNSLKKELYAKTVLLSRFLNIIDIPDDKVISLEEYNANKYTFECFRYEFEGFRYRNASKLRTDYLKFMMMFETEISNIISNNNDIINRIGQFTMNITPEKFENLKKEIEDLAEVQNDTKTNDNDEIIRG